jgi:hypothetical protein
MATRSAPLLLAHYLLHDNPYQAPQSDKLAQASAERPAKRRAIHSPLRGAIIGAITGGVPLLALIVIDALISYGDMPKTTTFSSIGVISGTQLRVSCRRLLRWRFSVHWLVPELWRLQSGFRLTARRPNLEPVRNPADYNTRMNDKQDDNPYRATGRARLERSLSQTAAYAAAVLSFVVMFILVTGLLLLIAYMFPFLWFDAFWVILPIAMTIGAIAGCHSARGGFRAERKIHHVDEDAAEQARSPLWKTPFAWISMLMTVVILYFVIRFFIVLMLQLR